MNWQFVSSPDHMILMLVSSPGHMILMLFFISRSHDPRAKGYIREEEFVQCLHTHLGSTSMDANVGQLVKVLQSGGVPPGWVPYPRFLAMFESKEQQQQLAKRSFSSQSTSLQASPEKPSSPRKLPTIATLDKVCLCNCYIFAVAKCWNLFYYW